LFQPGFNLVSTWFQPGFNLIWLVPAGGGTVAGRSSPVSRADP